MDGRRERIGIASKVNLLIAEIRARKIQKWYFEVHETPK